jgi:hypothetical protein
MKIFLAVLFALLSSAALARQKKHHSANEWDELESMLKNIDNIDKIKDIRTRVTEQEEKEEAEEDDDEDDAFIREAFPHDDSVARKNPCEGYHCGWGKECVVKAKGKPRCTCIRECRLPDQPQPFDKVCSNQNETFDSICHLYRERCLCKKGKSECFSNHHKRAHLEYLGQCKQLDTCTDEMMSQFPSRMADWLFQVMKDLDEREELHGDSWIHMIHEAQRDEHLKHIYPVIWKFCDLDSKPHNREVSQHELVPLIAPVMPMESCIKPFLDKCDTNDDQKISLSEWGMCLGLKEDEILEQC